MPTPLFFELTREVIGFLVLPFLLGLLFGSFLNVCISRLPRGESIIKPGSHCPTCGHPIRWYDNIPILSWLLLRARCRDCQTAISWRYPLIELAVGLWFLWIGLTIARVTSVRIGPPLDSTQLTLWWTVLGIEQAGFAILGFLLIGLMVMDCQTHRLPDAFTVTGTVIGFFLICAQAIFLAPGEDQVLLPAEHMRLRSPGVGAVEGNVFLTGPEALIFGRIAAIAGAALLLLIVRWAYKALRKRDGMGLGDVKMLAMIAAFLGFAQSLLALFVGVLTASLYGLVLIARGKAAAATRLPFGSFLAAGGLFAALFGPRLVDWYLSLMHY